MAENAFMSDPGREGTGGTAHHHTGRSLFISTRIYGAAAHYRDSIYCQRFRASQARCSLVAATSWVREEKGRKERERRDVMDGSTWV